MTSFSKNKKTLASSFHFGERGLFGGLLFLAVSLVFLSVVRPSLTSSLSMTATDYAAPVLKTLYSPFQNAAAYIGNVSGIATLKAENARLQLENERLKEWYQTALMLQAENKSLQSLLNLQMRPNQKYITVRTLSDIDTPFSQTLLINAGDKSTIKKNDIALSGQGVIGRVIESGKNYSRIMLLSDVNSRIPVKISGTNLKAVLRGNNAALPYLQFLSDDAVIESNNTVVTSGDAGIFPAGLPVGTVLRDPSGQYLVKPYSDLVAIEYVRLLQMSENPYLIQKDY